MTTNELRKCINVHTYLNDSDGTFIGYHMRGIPKVLTLNHFELLNELLSIGSIEPEFESEDLIFYPLSQWDALNMAIRYELRLEIENEINNSDIGKAINNIIK